MYDVITVGHNQDEERERNRLEVVHDDALPAMIFLARFGHRLVVGLEFCSPPLTIGSWMFSADNLNALGAWMNVATGSKNFKYNTELHNFTFVSTIKSALPIDQVGLN
ncbi:hypothetical protein PF005_g1559 [Phytophthora fragariae]|uniref:Uncharacterized protein n=2 Tax=Phytophthora fragariae TaxID=53985 RepID=A0A6A3ZE35_9STRA|nr:hypothetical protein PF003_g19842 [Phytophthora fragariae]KAE9235144.1 hypothetical protein PF005_g1559 [Phytophthora fragariae]KAE9361095.1 hypothetical protein PF008_g1325 [Phytophthora fragariae]